MEPKHKAPNIELRSEEVQELMGKIPPFILRMGISVIFVFVALIFVASNFIKYPDIISIPIVAKNVSYVVGIKAAKSGLLIESHMEHGRICKGEVLAKIVANRDCEHDTISVMSPFSGVVYPCDVFQKFNYIEKNSVLCVVVDSIKDKIKAKAFVTADLKKYITKGMTVESSINNNPLVGKVTSIADYANPYNVTYTISMEFETPVELGNTIIWNSQANAKIKITEQSVFNKFFKNKIVSN